MTDQKSSVYGLFRPTIHLHSLHPALLKWLPTRLNEPQKRLLVTKAAVHSTQQTPPGPLQVSAPAPAPPHPPQTLWTTGDKWSHLLTARTIWRHYSENLWNTPIISAAHPQEVLSQSPQTLHPGTGRYRCVRRTCLQLIPKRLQQCKK